MQKRCFPGRNGTGGGAMLHLKHGLTLSSTGLCAGSLILCVLMLRARATIRMQILVKDTEVVGKKACACISLFNNLTTACSLVLTRAPIMVYMNHGIYVMTQFGSPGQSWNQAFWTFYFQNCKMKCVSLLCNICNFGYFNAMENGLRSAMTIPWGTHPSKAQKVSLLVEMGVLGPPWGHSR